MVACINFGVPLDPLAAYRCRDPLFAEWMEVVLEKVDRLRRAAAKGK